MQIEPGLFTKLQAEYFSRYGAVGVSLSEYREIVAKDLEDLLNTKKRPNNWGGVGFVYLEKSVWSFGVSDFSGFYFGSVLDLDEVCRRVRIAVETHEPRLRGVEVTIAETSRSVGGLGLTIAAVLTGQGVSEDVQFSAFLDIVNKKYAVAAA